MKVVTDRTFLSTMRRAFQSPSFPDEEMTRACNLLNIIIWFLMLLCTILCISFLPVRYRPSGLVLVWDWSFIALVVTLVFFGVLLRMVHHGRYQMATRLLLAHLFVGITWSAAAFQGLQDGTISAYYLLVAIAALLLDGRTALRMTAVIFLALLGLLVGERTGFIFPPGDADHSLYELLVHSVLLIMFAFILHLTMYNLRSALAQARHELSERRRTELALRESERFTEAILNSLPNGVAVLNAQGGVVQVNTSWRDQESPAEAASPAPALQDYHDICQMVSRHEPEKAAHHQKTIEALLRGRKPFFEVEYPALEGAQWFWLRAAPLTHERRGLVVARTDVTARRQAEEQMRHQERLAAIGQLAAGIAHDFNNVLAVILLYAQLTLLDADLPEAGQYRVSTIVEQAERASTLVQQILDFGRRAVLERRPLALSALLQEQVELLARTMPDNVVVSLQVEDARRAEELLINADRTRIQQVIMNLAVNARDAMPRGGELIFGLEQRSLVTAVLTPQTLIPVGHWACLTVADTGSGIAPDALPHIFEPFFTTKGPGKGTGLGLAQVYGIIAQHEGHVTIQQSGPTGTTFAIYLPLVQAGASQSVTNPEPDFPLGQGENVLIVEDNAAIREVLLISLQALNYRPVVVENGRAALDVLTADGTAISLILSDYLMPDIDGLSLAITLEQQGFTIPIILLTGYRPEADEPWPTLIKAQLLKPIDLNHLARTLWRVLHEPAHDGQRYHPV